MASEQSESYVLAPFSARRWIVLRLSGRGSYAWPTGQGRGRTICYRSADIVHGPDTREHCQAYMAARIPAED